MKFKHSLILILTLTLFNTLSVKAQSSILVTKTGYMALSNTESLYFTIRFDEPSSLLPEWGYSNELQLIENRMYLKTFERSEIIKGKSAENPLQLFQKWETDYIKSNMDPSVKRSQFISDKNSGIALKNINSNAWYYSVDLGKSEKIYFYFFDIYINGSFIRIEFIGKLEHARLYTKLVVDGMRFYKNKIDIASLQNALRNGKYHYDE